MEISHLVTGRNYGVPSIYFAPNVRIELTDYQLSSISPKIEKIPWFKETFTTHEDNKF